MVKKKHSMKTQNSKSYEWEVPASNEAWAPEFYKVKKPGSNSDIVSYIKDKESETIYIFGLYRCDFDPSCKPPNEINDFINKARIRVGYEHFVISILDDNNLLGNLTFDSSDVSPE